MTLIDRTLPALAALALLLAPGCDQSDAPAGPATDVSDQQDVQDVQPEVQEEDVAEEVEEDISEPVDPHLTGETPDPTWEGPYDTAKFEITPNFKLWDPFAQQWAFLSDYADRDDIKMIIVSSAAGWCEPCKIESVEFQDFYEEHRESGLMILYALFETPTGAAFNVDDSYTQSFSQSWKDAYGIEYPLLIDPKVKGGDFELLKFWEDSSVPFAMIIKTDEMRIRYKAHGYSAAFMEYEILKHLYN